MNLKSMTDTTLIDETLTLVREERRLLGQVLCHFKEIERRRLFCDYGFGSLFEMATRYFGYPEDQAYRRVSGMKLLKELPEVEEKINSGAINLSHIGLAQSLFKNEMKSSEREMSKAEKLEVFEKISNKSVREAEKLTLSLSKAIEKPLVDQIKLKSFERIDLHFSASAELREKVEKLKARLAHKPPHLSLGELFEKLCDLGLETWIPGEKVSTSRKRRVKEQAQGGSSKSDVNEGVDITTVS